MPDLPSPEQVGGILGGLFGARAAGRGLARLLGPATDEVAEALRRWTAYRLGNVARIADNANVKLDEPNKPGQVPPRVAMRIFEEGSYSDDDVVVEYLGGVLASSRTPIGRDDRGNTFAAVVARMSSYELRTHYVCYTIMRQLLVGHDINFLDRNAAFNTTIYIPHGVYRLAMDFSLSEDWDTLLSHALHWLQRDDLMNFVVSTDLEPLRERYAPYAEKSGMIVTPTPPGIELYLWAHGKGSHPIPDFLDPMLSWEFPTGVPIPPGSQIVAEMVPSNGGSLDLS